MGTRYEAQTSCGLLITNFLITNPYAEEISEHFITLSEIEILGLNQASQHLYIISYAAASQFSALHLMALYLSGHLKCAPLLL